MRDGDRQAAMAALMSCSVFACIISSSDLGADELQGECTEVIPPPHSASHFGLPSNPPPTFTPPSHPHTPLPQNLLFLSLALELHDRGFIPRIFPLLISDGNSMEAITQQYEVEADIVNAATALLLQVTFTARARPCSGDLIARGVLVYL